MEKVIYIRDQKDFDNINESIMGAMKGLEDNSFIDLIFTKKRFTFHDNHIKLFNLSGSQSIRITGNGATIQAEQVYGKISDSDNYKRSANTIFGPVEVWSKAYAAESEVEVLVKELGYCRVRCPKVYDIYPDTILITTWFKSEICQTTSSTAVNYIYFYSKDIGLINGDYSYGKVYPRIKVPRNRKAWLSNSGTFMAMDNCSITKLAVSDLKFSGNCGSADLIRITNSNTDVTISGCTFNNIMGIPIYGYMCNRMTISGNTFKNCYADCIHISDCKNSNFPFIGIFENRFRNNGLGLTNSACIRTSSPSYLIVKNDIKNYGYCGVNVGVWYGNSNPAVTYGIISNNKIGLSRLYDIRNRTLMDSGAIYVCTLNESVRILNNYIYRTGGIKDNRGIFLDDGAINVTIQDNVIKGTRNSYSIDSRRCKEIEEDPKSLVKVTNINNWIENNTLTEPYRFEGNECNDNECVLGSNYLTYDDANTVSNVKVKYEDIRLFWINRILVSLFKYRF